MLLKGNYKKIEIKMHKLLPEVQAFAEGLELPIPTERKELLQQLGSYIQNKLEKGEPVNLNFICTHNSRRSQLCQVWAQTAAFYFGIDRLHAFSGGTEATAFHPNAIRALKTTGFKVFEEEGEPDPTGSNPVYLVRYSPEAAPMSCFSKLYNDPFNASTPFAAVTTCSDAERNCPFIPEAEERFSIKYEDPKKADGTPEEEQTYLERSRQIAAEMFYVFSNIKK